MDPGKEIRNLIRCRSVTEQLKMEKTQKMTSLDMAPLMKAPKDNKKNQLIDYWQQKNFEGFLCELGTTKDLDRVYEEHDNYCLLELVVKSSGNEDYLRALVDAGVNVNRKNDNTGEVALHYAAEEAKIETVRILLNGGADPNIQNIAGDTPLHKLILRWDATRSKYEETLQLFLNSPDIAVNVANSKGLTPIYLAATQVEETVVAELLRLGDTLDLDTFQCLAENKTAREIISKNFPGLESELPVEWKPDLTKGERDFKYRLFYYLLSDKETKFCQLLREATNLSGINMGSLLSSLDGRCYTYLQCASKLGLARAGRKLIQYGADVNFASHGTDPPITLAVTGKSTDLLCLFLNVDGIDLKPDPATGETLLHKAVKLTDNSLTQYETLRKLVKQTSIDINAKDNLGRTPLHLAVAIENERNIFLLLDNGAKLDMVNNYGEIPLKQISRPTLLKYLDNKITTNTDKPKHTDFCYIFDYKFFTSNDNTHHIYGVFTDLLKQIKSSNELRTLLAHPIFSTIILFKWYRVRLYFYLDLFFFTLFGFSLTFSIFYSPILLKSTCNTTETLPEINTGCYNHFYFITMQSFVLLFATVLAASEFYQFISSPGRYFTFIENWLQIGVVITTYTLVGTDCLKNSDANTYCKDISAIALFFAWFEFFFVIGQHPKTTSYVDMFRTASVFLLQFLAVHTCLILAFVFSFHVMFKESIAFSTIPDAFFKTIIMITGEYEIAEIPLNNLPYTAHFLFSAFIFLVATVLFNLLIGLAVSATKPIEEDPFLFSCLAQVPIIHFFENIFFNDSHFILVYLRKLLHFTPKPKDDFKSYSILYIYPNQGNRMEIRKVWDEGPGKKIHVTHQMTNKILEDTQNIINQKIDEANLKCDKFEEIKNHIDSTKAALDDELKIVRTTLVELLEKMEKKNSTDEVEILRSKKVKSELVKNKLRQFRLPGSSPKTLPKDKPKN